ncbi:MAG TPA: ABC transporter ATP-binding protein [Candidatus Acidoferrum sp.]|nr:ABC transporter ATP-binding protein [Candidatus Acidoferrum sp.]
MWKLLRRMNRRDAAFGGVCILFAALQVWLDLKIPDYMADITRITQSKGASSGSIWGQGGMMLLCALGSLAFAILTGLMSARLAAGFSRQLRGEIFDRVEDFSMEEIDRFSTASLITRSTNDITQIQNLVARGFNQFVRAPLVIAVAFAKISTRHWQWSAMTGAAVFLVVLALVFVVKYAHPKFRAMQDLTDDLNMVVRENLTGIRVIRAYNAETYEREKFEGANGRLTSNAIKARRGMQLMPVTNEFASNLLTVGIYCSGAFMIVRTAPALQLGLFSEMVVFSTYAAKIIQGFMRLNFIFMMLPRASVSAHRLSEVLDTPPTIKDGGHTEGVAGEAGTVEFRQVSFHYPDSPADVLTDITFSAKRGETVALIGATGSGKTTIVNLLLRFFDPTGGQVLVDGRDARQYTQDALRRKLGYAPQLAVLFTGTVRSNVTYGEERSKESAAGAAVRDALEIAQGYDFVSKMPGGVDAAVARGGTNVSGGQKQRISVARAVYRKPEIYIFDDTFSALDYKTDRALRAALKQRTAGVTTFIVAQRIGTIREADRILVLDDGKIVGSGTHRELLENCDVYREIARTQLSEEELSQWQKTVTR